MAEEPRDIVLEHLRHIRATTDGLKDEVRSVNLRLTAIEHHLAGNHITEVDQNTAIDHLKRRVDRIERRLELSDTD